MRLYVLSTMLHANLVGQCTGQGYLIALILILVGALVLYIDHKMLGARKSFVTISGSGHLLAFGDGDSLRGVGDRFRDVDPHRVQLVQL